ncbi:MAG: FAD-dependent oxidoreductase [Verrucomicrobium sp.]|nr:FAD-dependent oxidoreductase [Verrucomicrobium sp.]
MNYYSFGVAAAPLPQEPLMMAAMAVREARTSIAVIGGGISGLTCALRLAESGNVVTLIESSGELGGLGGTFEHDGRSFEKFYHCLLPSDGPLLQLLTDIGLRHEIYWKPTTFAYAQGQRIFPLNTPLDLLRFGPLSWWGRIRVGFTGLYGRLSSERGLDEITAADWLTRLSGRHAFATFWKPMLQAKFGDRFADVPALWFWSRFNREKGGQKGEMKGYLKGGYRRIAEVVRQRLDHLGVTVRLKERVSRVDLDAANRPVVSTDQRNATAYDKIVFTSPWPGFESVVGPALSAAMPPLDHGIDYQGVINCLLFLKRPLTPHYWVATPEDGCPFDGVIETSTLTDEADRGPRHVVYLTKYMHRDDARFAADEVGIANSWWQSLRRLFPDLKEEDLERSQVFKAPFVEPIYTTGYQSRRPPEVLVPGRVYLSSTVQVYPTVTSWNGSVAQAGKTLACMAEAAAVS